MANDSKSNQEGDVRFLRTVLVSAICIPLIVGLIYFAYTKKEQAPIKNKECEQKCTQEGYSGFDFKWSVFSDSKCACFGEKSR